MYRVDLDKYDIHIRFTNKDVLTKALCILSNTIRVRDKHNDDVNLRYSNGTSYIRVYGDFKLIDCTIDKDNGPFLYTIHPIRKTNLDALGILKWSDYIRKQIPRRLFNEF